LHRSVGQARILSARVSRGLRSNDGRLHFFRPGIGMMAMRLQLPIVPINIEGLYSVYLVHDSWPKRGAVRVSFGRPLRFKAETYEEVAQTVRRAIEDLGRPAS